MAGHDPCQRAIEVARKYSGKLNPSSMDLSKLHLEMVLVAEEDLTMGSRSRLLTAAALLCSGRKLHLRQSVTVSSYGRGCPPGQGGAGRGETRSHRKCGGGGASNLGRGGDGAHWMATGSQSLVPCATPGQQTTFERPRLPLDSAPGGGCGVEANYCYKLYEKAHSIRYSAGGGLIWLSAPATRMAGGVRVISDGAFGSFTIKDNTNGDADQPDTSGGGAGGQVIVYTDNLLVPSSASELGWPRLSAKGGDAQCSSQTASVGGAGGGGFIGLEWRSKTQARSPVKDPTRLLLDVGGGRVTEKCADFLPQKFQDSVLGGPGLATTLTPCQPGLAGPVCQPCPVGLWGDGEGTCQECTNHLGKHGIYTTEGWANETCPYQCIPGLPAVQINPDCLNNIDFAVSFFGGKVGFLAAVACPILMFMGVRLAHRWRQQRKRRVSSVDGSTMNGLDDAKALGGDRGLWHFPPEQLPLHVRRIFLQGHNSPELPWTLPGSGTEANSAVLVSAIPTLLQTSIRPESWAELVKELTKTMTPPRKEKWSLNVLWCCSPPLCELMAWIWRRRRARAVDRQLRAFNQGLLGRGGLWKPDARNAARPDVRFGCDDRATVGYLDIFDHSRSPLDWAPADLRKNEQRFLAAGHGTWTNPFELPVVDPLFQGLAQTLGHSGSGGAQVLFSLVCTFNLFSRVLPAAELEAAAAEAADSGELGNATTTPALCTLIHEVERCSHQHGLQGSVEVQLASVARPNGKPSVVPGPSRPSEPLVADSFTDLVRQMPATFGDPLPDADNALEPGEDLKLCLVFSGKHHAGRGLLYSVSDLLSSPRDAALQPLARASAVGTGLHPRAQLLSLGARLRRALIRWRCRALLPWTCTAQNLHVSYLLLVVLFFTMILLNAMVCVVLGFSLCRISSSPYAAVATWLLLPTPFAPVLSPCIGFSALILKEPSWGRIHSEIAIRSFANVLLTSVAFWQLELVLPLGMALLFDALVGSGAAVYAGLEMSSADLAAADDSVGTSLELQVSGGSRGPGSYFARSSTQAAPAKPREISMTVLPSMGSPSLRSTPRARGESAESDFGVAEVTSPF
ncbi:pim2 [Symbiodinium natans]|uniref:Pim2 protein n=1 Tax=Symbiodinium natans TaxID=878477 RepID=A0A812J8X2_9DINO|nr:pim2 [Symbiodinium natans]